MNWRLFLQVLQKTYTNQLIRLKEKGGVGKTTKLLNSLGMEPAKKMQTFMPEECEMIININSKGACRFDIISKIESVCSDHTVNFSTVKDGEQSVDLEKSCTVKAAAEATQSGDLKSLGDIATRIPPTSQYVALDCEFVGVLGDISALGRCSIISYEGEVICDIYAKPVERITTYRTRWSGIRKKHMNKAIPLESALSQISDIIQDKIVVGHGIHNDFRVLGFSHPEHLIRDTQKSRHLLEKMYQENDIKQLVSLKRMAHTLLGKTIQTGAHCSVVDATVAMELFKLVREEWETSLLQNGRQPSDENDHDQASSNTEETMDTKQDKSNKEELNCVDKMLSFSRTLNGKITKKKKKNKKCTGLRAHFGQIIGGNKNLTDYFKEDETLKKSGDNKLDVLKNKVSVYIKNRRCLEGDNVVSVSDKVSTLASDMSMDVQSGMSLRDGKTYVNATASVGKNGSRQRSTEKYHLKTQYAQTIKHLFNDQFWQDLPVTADCVES